MSLLVPSEASLERPGYKVQAENRTGGAGDVLQLAISVTKRPDYRRENALLDSPLICPT
jgi:hypothetical protein